MITLILIFYIVHIKVNGNRTKNDIARDLSYTEDYWFDIKFNNSWSRKKFTYKEVLKLMKSMKRSYDCIDCEGCTDCRGCCNCTYCHRCIECSNLIYSEDVDKVNNQTTSRA